MMGVGKQVPEDLRRWKKWWWCILPIIMVVMKLYKSVKSTKIGVGHWQWWSSLLFLFACQVLEYHPHPWDQWVSIGDLVHARRTHATLSIGVEQLPCFSGESFNIEMILWWCEKRRLIDKQRGFPGGARSAPAIWASRRASAQAVTSKWHFRTTSPTNTNSSAGENWFSAKNGP